MNQKQIGIQQAIYKIVPPYPKDNLVSSYADFLKVRCYIPYFKFNPNVLDSLLELTNNCWTTNKRINRLSLIQSIKYYKDNNKESQYLISENGRKLAFDLFKKVFEEPAFISQKQLEEVRKLCNIILMNLSLSEDEEIWLCENVLNAGIILNRVLRYPVKSSVISNWAKENFQNNEFRNRRAELISWLIDVDPKFEIDKQTLIDDFEYLNWSDIKAIEEYDKKMEISRKENEPTKINDAFRVHGYFSDDIPPSFNYNENITHFVDDENITDLNFADVSEPELKLSRRFYNIPKDFSKQGYQILIPDFEQLRKDFYNNIDITLKTTMLWAITYTRLDNNVKAELLKKYYSEDTYKTFFKVSRKLKQVEILEWLKGKQ